MTLSFGNARVHLKMAIGSHSVGRSPHPSLLPSEIQSQGFYFHVGRGDFIRMTLAQLGLEFDEVTVGFDEPKSKLEAFPCGQCPRYVDEDVDMVQSNAIIRHLGRKHGLTGSTLKEQAHVDMILDTVEALKPKYIPLIYFGQLNDETKAEYISTRLDPTTAAGSNGGAHFAFVDAMVKKMAGDGPFVLGSKLTVADIAVFDVMESQIHGMGLGEEFKAKYPALMAHHAAVAALPNIAAFLSSQNRPGK